MKAKLFTALAIGALLSGLGLNAQTNPTVTNVPFDFVVAGDQLPAGEYEMWTSAESANLLSISGTDQKHYVVTLVNMVESAGIPPRSKLVFSKYGDRYFLHEIWTAGNRTGHSLLITQKESNVAQKRTSRQVIVFASQSNSNTNSKLDAEGAK